MILVVSGAYGVPLLGTAEKLVGPLGLSIIEVGEEESAGELRQRIKEAIEGSAQVDSVLLLTDLYGSTPANVCLSLLSEYPGSEMIAGINLAMLIKLSTCERSLSAGSLAHELQRTAQRSIQLGLDFLRKGGPCSD